MASLTDDLNDVGNLIDAPTLYHQAYRPGIAYLNGEYWGIHNLREHMSAAYIEQHFGLSDSEMDFMDNIEVKEGTEDGWNEFKGFVEQADFTDDTSIDQLAQMVELPNFLDYYVFNIIVDNSDWPGNNYRRWRKNDDGQWKFMVFDLDFSFGMFNHVPGGPTWNTGDASANSLARSLDDSQTGWPNPQWNTLYFRKPMENAGFRKNFINRTADFLNVLFDADRVNSRIDDFKNTYLPEIQKHMDKWNGSYNPFEENVDKLRLFANDRPDIMRQHVVDAFSEVTGTADLTLEVSPAGAGSIEFSTINFEGSEPNWTGEYFTGVDIPVGAVPAPGFVFDGWSLASLGSTPSGEINLSGDLTLIAYFSPSTAQPQPIVINEINYNSPDAPNSGDWVELYNPNNQSVDLTEWALEDGGGGVFNIPAGTVMPPDSYLLLAENTTEFSAVYNNVGEVIGNFGEGITGFKLSNNSEAIFLKNAAQDTIDTIEYDDEAPWPPAADGNGPTLQLIEPTLDNALAASWIAQQATPGKENVVTLMAQTIDFPVIPDMFTTDLPYQLNATATSGLPVEYTVTTGPATVSGDTLTLDGVVGLIFIEANQPGNADWEAAPSVVRAFRVTEEPVISSYCGSVGQSPWLEWIARVSFAGIDNESGKETYGDFTAQIAQVGLGETITLTVEPTFSWDVHDEYIRAWIDFNGDFDFNDPGEMVLEGIANSALSAAVTIPSSAMIGDTRMRISMQRDQYAMPCDTFSLGEVEDYTVNISQSSLLPQTIDFQPISTQQLGAQPFSLNASATSGLPVVFEIVSGPATLSNTTLSLTDQTGEVIIRATQPGDSQWQAAPPILRTFEVVAPTGTYCTSSGQEPWFEWIERVNFGTIDHTSFKEPYADFTNISTIATRGQTLSLSITPEYSWIEHEEHFRAWIDFNQDGDFEDMGEMVLEAIGNTTVSENVLIPLNAALGTTRLRISMQRGAFADPCDQFLWGEVHDYGVEIKESIQPPTYDDVRKVPHSYIAPNPTGDQLNATISIAHEGEATLTVINAYGIQVAQKKTYLKAGKQNIQMDISVLKNGTYMLWIQPSKQKAMAERFVKMRE